MKFTEARLEQAIIELLAKQGCPHVLGETISREPDEVLIKEDLKNFLAGRYADDNITTNEIDAIIRKLETLPASDLYESNKAIMKMVADGFLLKWEDRSQKDLYVQLIDYKDLTEFHTPRAGEVTTVIVDPPAPYHAGNNIFKMGKAHGQEIDLFDEDYLARIEKIKLPNTKIKILQHLLAKAIDDFKKINKVMGIDFSKKFKDLVEKYNERKEQDVLVSNVLEDFTDEIIDLFHALKKEKESFAAWGLILRRRLSMTS